MCNPPFYVSQEDVEKSARGKDDPANAVGFMMHFIK